MCVVLVFVPLQRLLIPTKPHGVTSEKNTALKLTAAGTSSLSLSIINVRKISAEIPSDSGQRITVRELLEGNDKEFYWFTFLSSCNFRILMSVLL